MGACIWVDDDYARYRGFLRSLRSQFNPVLEFDSYAAAKRHLETGRPDCCILDVILPYEGSLPSFDHHIGVLLSEAICESSAPPALVVFLSIQSAAELPLDAMRRKFPKTTFEHIPKLKLAFSNRQIVSEIAGYFAAANKARQNGGSNS